MLRAREDKNSPKNYYETPREMKMYRFLTGLMLLVSLVLPQLLQAQLTLPEFFSDDMVLQRDRPIRLWGYAPNGSLITVRLGSDTGQSTANIEGYWELSLPARPAGGPHQLQVSGAGTSIQFQNVMMGEVWLCAGQSNMERPLKVSDDGFAVAASADFPNIRYFKVPRRLSTEPVGSVPNGAWEVCTPSRAENFSAVAFYFARDLHQSLGVPLGIIDISWGGTGIDTWISPEGLSVFPVEEITGGGGQTTDLGPNGAPSLIYHGMVHPFVGLQMQGVVWYQGETNASSPHYYRNKQIKLIDDWRRQWCIGDFPFLVTQLASFRETPAEPDDSNWATLRESQFHTLKRTHTGLITLIDAGEADDIHPGDKETPGLRFARLAKKLVYGYSSLIAMGPSFQLAEVRASDILIHFRTYGSNLRHQTGGTALRGFAIAGADGEFVWANAQIHSSSSVRVWHPAVPAPRYVRYAWADNPGPLDLYNAVGLPAFPFRTDKLPTPWD